MRTYFIKTYGCQMNVADSSRLEAALEAAGYYEFKAEDSEIKKLEPVDLILVNTCVVRQTAEDRAAWYITSLKGLKDLNPNLKIGVCGCIVPEPGRDLKKQFPHVDFFIPPNSPEKLAKVLSSPLSSPSPIRASEHSFPSPSKMERGGKPHDSGVRFVTIMTGCDNFCSYCVVPYVRGREVSRPMEEVLAEIKALVGEGIGEITLLGQNVNSYKFGFAKLLRGIGGIFREEKGGARIRFMTSHPKDMSDEIIDAVAELPYVAKELHLPLQAGDDEILRRMNRGYTVEYYRNLVVKIRARRPDTRISTDVMVGFPGETDLQFQNLLTLMKELRFSMINMFAFSARPQTAAAKMPAQVPKGVKQLRLKKLIETNRQMLYNRRGGKI